MVTEQKKKDIDKDSEQRTEKKNLIKEGKGRLTHNERERERERVRVSNKTHKLMYPT